MRPDTITPDLVLDRMGSRLEHHAELGAWPLLRPYRGIQFPDLAQTRVRLANAGSPAARWPLPLSISPQLSFGWDVGGQREDPPCLTV